MSSAGSPNRSFGDGAAQTTAYDTRMRPSQYRLTCAASALREDFTYYTDGRLQRLTDPDDTGTGVPSYAWRNLSRVYKYDLLGRVTEAGGNTGGSDTPSPYRHFYGYDDFNNMTSRSGICGYQPSHSDTAAYGNDRRQGWTYDAAGNLSASTTDVNSGSSALVGQFSLRVVPPRRLSG